MNRSCRKVCIMSKQKEQNDSNYYKYNDTILKTLLETSHNSIIHPIAENGDNITKKTAEKVISKLLENFFLIRPNPLDKNFLLLVYDIESHEKYFSIYDKSRDTYVNLREQYNIIDEWLGGFSDVFSFDEFKRKLEQNIFIEDEKTSSNIYTIHNKGANIYDFENMKFQDKSVCLPSKKNKTIKNEVVEKEDLITLDKYFNIMFNTNESFEQFLFYILCNFNKKYVQQSVFLVIDVSGVGKTSRIKAFTDLGLNNIATTGLLKSTELYNLVNCNSIIFNEAQSSKLVKGDLLNMLCDNTSLQVTRKGESAVTLLDSERPLIQIMGETLPFIESLSNGTTRRLLLVPKASTEYIKLTANNLNKLKNEFFSILNEKPITTLTYYLNKIKEYNIIEKSDKIKESMAVTLDEIENLLESTEIILEDYFNLNPHAKNDNFSNSITILEINSLEPVLDYINQYILTTNHFKTPKEFKNYFIHLLKENTGRNNIKDFGVQNKNNKNYYYAYQLTKKGEMLIDNIKKLKKYKNKIYSSVAYPQA